MKDDNVKECSATMKTVISLGRTWRGVWNYRGVFWAEKNGPKETELKNALRVFFQNRQEIKEAYLVDFAHANGSTSRMLCLRAPFTDKIQHIISAEIGDIFAPLFDENEYIDILYLDDIKEAELVKVCEPFFERPDAAEILSRPPTPFPFKKTP